jgi:hypothetical protein
MVTAQLSAEHFGNSIYVLADIPINHAAWNISIAGDGALGGIKSPWTLEALLRLDPRFVICFDRNVLVNGMAFSTTV